MCLKKQEDASAQNSALTANRSQENLALGTRLRLKNATCRRRDESGFNGKTIRRDTNKQVWQAALLSSARSEKTGLHDHRHGSMLGRRHSSPHQLETVAKFVTPSTSEHPSAAE